MTNMPTRMFILSVLVCTCLLSLWYDCAAWGQARGYQPKIQATATPTVNPAIIGIRQKEEIYEGYAKLFVLMHVFIQASGVPIALPSSINLDFFTQQPMLAESMDIFVYRPAERVDIMWPLILPTPLQGFQPLPPTETPTPYVTPTPETTPVPSPTPSPTEVIPPQLELKSITVSDSGSWIMIGDQIYTVGDVVSDATITHIDKKIAVIRYYGKEFIVTKKGTVTPDEYKNIEFDLE